MQSVDFGDRNSFGDRVHSVYYILTITSENRVLTVNIYRYDKDISDHSSIQPKHKRREVGRFDHELISLMMIRPFDDSIT